MQHANFTAWAKACNLLDDKWYVYQYIRRLKTYHRQGQKCDEKTKKKKKQNDKIPSARIWSLTTDRNMVQSDALPTEPQF